MPLVELPGFVEKVRRHSWKGSLALACYDGRRACTRCSVGHVVRLGPVVQPALFVHGGYGAAVSLVVSVCLACGGTSVLTSETVNPRRLAS